MTNRYAVSVAGVATALLLLGACSGDDGPTTLAEGSDVDFVGTNSLADQTMDITAEETDGTVTGEARFDPAGLTLDLQCADTDTDGLVMLGGEATADSADGSAAGDWRVVIIRKGDPAGVVVWFPDEGAVGSCAEALETLPADHRTADSDVFFDVEDGDDIAT